MILYHGSNKEVPVVDLAKCKPYRDFGTGFYMTLYSEQAKRMAARTARIYGGGPVVSIFHYNDVDITNLSIRIFDKPSTEWAHFVMNNRSRYFTDVSSLECNFDGKYDIVMGPVANDDMTLLFRLFSEGLLPIETLAHEMEYRELTNQYSFHTEAAVSRLTYRGVQDE